MRGKSYHPLYVCLSLCLCVDATAISIGGVALLPDHHGGPYGYQREAIHLNSA